MDEFLTSMIHLYVKIYGEFKLRNVHGRVLIITSKCVITDSKVFRFYDNTYQCKLHSDIYYDSIVILMHFEKNDEHCRFKVYNVTMNKIYIQHTFIGEYYQDFLKMKLANS